MRVGIALQHRSATVGHNRTGQDRIHLHSVLDPPIGEGLGESQDRGVDCADSGQGHLGRVGRRARRDRNGATRRLKRIPGRDREAAGGVEFEREPVVPLFVREREHVGLRDGTSDTGNGVDPAEGVVHRSDDDSGRVRLAQVPREEKRFRSRRPDRIRRSGQGFLVSAPPAPRRRSRGPGGSPSRARYRGSRR